MNIKTKEYMLLDVVKFLSSIAIVLYHYNVYLKNLENIYLVRGGYIAVEIFFVLSGFFLGNSILNKESSEVKPAKIVLIRMRRMWPDYFVALFFSTITYSLYYGFHKSDLIEFVKEAIYVQEWLPIRTQLMINSPMWYISAMFCGMFILLVVLKILSKYREAVSLFLFCAGSVFCLVHYGTLRIHGQFLCGIISTGVIRAIINMSLGMLIAFNAKKWKIGRRMAVFLGILGVMGCAVLFFVAHKNRLDFLVYPFLVCLILGIINIPNSYSAWINPKALLWAKDVSWILYLCQKAFILFCLVKFPEISMGVYFAVLIIIATFWHLVKTYLPRFRV